MAARRVSILAFPGVQSIDVFGPAEVFSVADRLAGGGEYAVELVAQERAAVETTSGIRIVPDRALAPSRRPIDTLVVAGGTGVREALREAAVIRWISRSAARSRRVCSVCTGAFLLAEAGLLDGRCATTHWASCDALARRHPEIDVDPDPIFVRDGRIATSAGVTAGIDLALALVEEDLGAEAARQVARWLVLFLQRPGLRELQEWIPLHLDEDLSVAVLAERAFMSPRNFARAFRSEVGTTPAAYVERLRVERARALLQSSDEAVEVVAARCGFGTVETLRRAFQRRVGVSPGQYRERFRPSLKAA